MARYLVERRFLLKPRSRLEGDRTVLLTRSRQTDDLGVRCFSPHISDDRQSTFWICDGPDPKSVREAWQRIGFHCDEITELGASELSY